MKLYTKEIDGKAVIKALNRIVLIKDEMQIINPTEEMVLEDGWNEYTLPQQTEEELIINAKNDKINDILAYDSSESVNSFYIGTDRVWLDKSTRTGLILRLQAERETGEQETTLWYNGKMYTFNLDIAFDMLYRLEIYASTCYDTTQHHIANVLAMSNIDEVKQYDNTVGYPDKLHF